jgi:hypothetical protein
MPNRRKAIPRAAGGCRLVFIGLGGLPLRIARQIAGVAAAIKRNMRKSSLQRRVFGERGSLGSFGAKIEIAYLLGVIHKATYQELENVRLIRNEFAHGLHAHDFNHAPIVSLMDKLTFLKAIESQTDDNQTKRSYSDVFNHFDMNERPYRFIATCILLNVVLMMTFKRGDKGEAAAFPKLDDPSPRS